ncbi:hypothetical protein GCM10011320_46910 [Neoroseomonas lacus]|uniref:Uncharacterized protein n=2 Tax=Neoroseomonas lacus TaxID=287609 RepID=A0A917NW40_9PROT|nr:hypothetical protein GCM10011320_46910 [Neoroseomonas lacus]
MALRVVQCVITKAYAGHRRDIGVRSGRRRVVGAMVGSTEGSPPTGRTQELPISQHHADACLATPTESAGRPVLRRATMRLLGLAQPLRPDALLRAMTPSARLSAPDLRDAGVRADQIGQAPIWGYGGIMWRP